jgi:putative nucleotidyltransferase with HDIG domain
MTTTASPERPLDAATEATLLVEELIAALVNVRIYAANHPRVTSSLANVRKNVRDMVELTGEQQVRITSAEGMLVYSHRPLCGASISAARLIELLKGWRSSGIELDATVAEEALHEFFNALVARPQPNATYQQFNEALAARHCDGARLMPPYVDERKRIDDGTLRLGLSFYQAVVDLLQNITVAVCRGGRIDFGPVASQAEEVLKRLERKDELQFGLARHDQYDAFTLGHSLRVAILSMNFAQTLTDDRALLIRIGTAALLHDVGKSLIPFEILHSSGTLSDEERRQMNQHAELGAKCLLDQRDADPLAVAAAFGHHRAPDGSGYPRTTHRHPVNLVTSIVKICDIFEALTAARPYKQPMSPIRAYRVMIAMGDRLDQALLRRFVETNGIYPVGQLVELDNGDVAVVREQGMDLLKPKVALVPNLAGLDLEEEDDQVFVLGDVTCCTARAILRELTPDEAKAKLQAVPSGDA